MNCWVAGSFPGPWDGPSLAQAAPCLTFLNINVLHELPGQSGRDFGTGSSVTSPLLCDLQNTSCLFLTALFPLFRKGKNCFGPCSVALPGEFAVIATFGQIPSLQTCCFLMVPAAFSPSAPHLVHGPCCQDSPPAAGKWEGRAPGVAWAAHNLTAHLLSPLESCRSNSTACTAMGKSSQS